MTSSSAIACLPFALSADERARSRELRQALAASTVSREERDDGYAFGLTPTALADAAAWLPLERRCCPFLTFRLEWTPGESAHPVLTLTGPEGAKEFLHAEMPELPWDEQTGDVS